MALTQLGQIAMMATDLAFIGRLGNQAVAAAAPGGHRVFRQLHHRHGAGLGGGAVGGAGLRRSRSAPGAALAAGRPARRAADFAADHAVLVLRRRHPAGAGARPGPKRISRSNICSAWCWGVTPALWFMAVRGFMARSTAAAGAVDHAGRDSGQRASGLSLIYGEWGFPRLELFGAGLATTNVQFRHPAGLAVVLPRAARRSGNITCSATSGASTAG